MATAYLPPGIQDRLQKAVQHAFEAADGERAARRVLLNIYKGKKSFLQSFLGDTYHNSRVRGTLVNYFKMYVRGMQTRLASNSPRWSIRSRTASGRGFDKRIQSFLNRYTELLNLRDVFKNCVLDASFGRAVIKVVTSIAPKGVHCDYAPRAFRINPDNFFVDRATASSTVDEASFMGDIYLVPLESAQQFPGFDPAQRESLAEYRMNTGHSGGIPTEDITSTDELFVEPMVRLVDVYLPSLKLLCTWQANTDNFDEIGSRPPLAVQPMPVNPYVTFSTMKVPNSTAESPPLEDIRELHFLANDMFHKAADQARKSKRNPTAPEGADEDFSRMLKAADGEAVFTNRAAEFGLYTLPGPDQSVVGLGQLAAQLLSQSSGNMEVALGLSAGASTARQTQAILGQIDSVSALDRAEFEEFMASVGMKLASFAFVDDMFQLEIIEQVPGTKFFYNLDWLNPNQLPRIGEIDDYHFEVVPYSTAYRTPQERISQLNAASQLLLQWMTVASQGAPINIGAVIKSVSEAFDLVGDLEEWWSGEKPSPAEQAVSAYTTTAAPPQGSEVNYNSNSQAGPMDGGGGEPSEGGMQMGAETA
jgi:hypothetical protein